MDPLPGLSLPRCPVVLIALYALIRPFLTTVQEMRDSIKSNAQSAWKIVGIEFVSINTIIMFISPPPESSTRHANK